MKKFGLILLSMGLVIALSVSAFAVDVKSNAEYYVTGMYLNKTSVIDDDNFSNPSTAFFYQRLRVGTDFVVSPGLKLVTRFDAMERIWGGARGGNDIGFGGADSMSAGTKEENQNIAFDLAYIDYTSPIGQFKVGYQPDYVWGTVFGDRSSGKPAGMITFATMAGPVALVAQYAKEQDNSVSYINNGYAYTTDKDLDSYRIGAIYNFKNSTASGELGGLLLFNRDATSKNWSMYGPGYLTNAYKLIPYFKANIGNVALQGEFEYTFGDGIKWEDDAGLYGYTNVTIGAISAWLDATVNLGTFYAGGTFAYLSGDDPGTSDKLEGGSLTNTSGLDWHPCLILFNTDMNYWTGDLYGYNGSTFNTEMSNAWFFQGRAGIKPSPRWDVMLALAYAQADKKPAGYTGGTYGTEVDLTATYKITNNLSYMLGAGYLFTGDYYKGADDGTHSVNNDYILINKLTLNF